LLPNSLRAAAEARLAKIPSIFGYAGDGRNFMLKKPVAKPEYDPQFAHQKYYYLNLFSSLGIPSVNSLPPLNLPSALKKENRVALFPGAEYGPAKRWPAKFFAQIAQQLKDERGVRAVLFGAKKISLLRLKSVAKFHGLKIVLAKLLLRKLSRKFSSHEWSFAMTVARCIYLPFWAFLQWRFSVLLTPTAPPQLEKIPSFNGIMFPAVLVFYVNARWISVACSN